MGGHSRWAPASPQSNTVNPWSLGSLQALDPQTHTWKTKACPQRQELGISVLRTPGGSAAKQRGRPLSPVQITLQPAPHSCHPWLRVSLGSSWRGGPAQGR